MNTQKAAAETPKKKHHHKTVASSQRKSPSKSETYFRSERLPNTIYKKSYDKLNKHLPEARYERDYNGLVFVTAQRDDLNGLRAVLDAGRSMEQVDSNGDTPLLVAVKHNAVNAVRLLLARHADASVTDSNGMTAMQVAKQNGNLQITQALKEAAGRKSE